MRGHFAVLPAHMASGAAETVFAGAVVLTGIKKMAAQTAAAHQVVGQLGGIFRPGVDGDMLNAADRLAAVTGPQALITIKPKMDASLDGADFFFMAATAALRPTTGSGWPGGHPLMRRLSIRRRANAAMADAAS